jgi:hypothetical protein
MANDVPFPNVPSNWVPFVQGGEDIIEVRGETLAAQQFEVVLESAPHVTWMKRIRVLDGHGVELQSISTQDSNHGPVTVVLPDGWSRLEFVKGKAFGIPTGMYVTPPTGQVVLLPVNSGWRLHFRWQKD